jgi:hypothetical protein
VQKNSLCTRIVINKINSIKIDNHLRLRLGRIFKITLLLTPIKTNSGRSEASARAVKISLHKLGFCSLALVYLMSKMQLNTTILLQVTEHLYINVFSFFSIKLTGHFDRYYYSKYHAQPGKWTKFWIYDSIFDLKFRKVCQCVSV